MGKDLTFGGREYSDEKGFGHFLNDSPRFAIMKNTKESPIINKYSCFVTNYFCFYYVRVTNVQMLTQNEKSLILLTILHRELNNMI